MPGDPGQFLYLLDQETGQYFYLKPGSTPRWTPVTPALFKPATDVVEADAGRPFPWFVEPEKE